MMELTGKQKSHLRSLGQRLPVTAAIGKEGMTAGVVAGIRALLGRHELVKVRLPADSPRARHESASLLAEAVGAACVSVLGRTALLYRPKEQQAKDVSQQPGKQLATEHAEDSEIPPL